MTRTPEDLYETKALVRKGLLEASTSFMATPPDILAKFCNGAGAADSLIPVPDTIYFLNCNPVFDIHDWDYKTGVTKEDKDDADDRMLTNGINFIEARSNWFTRFLRVRRMLKYYEAVRDFGDDAFWAGKS